MEILKRTFESKVKITDDGLMEVTISTKAKDRYGDIVEPAGCVFENFLNNPVVTFAHDYRSIPIGRAEGLIITDEGIVSKVLFAPGDVNPIAPYIKKAYEQGFMKTWSIGFLPIEKEPILGEDGLQTGWRYTKWELLEYSAVPIPANPETGTNLKGLLDEVEKYIEKKEICGKNNLPLWDEASWDGDAAVNNIAKFASYDGSGDKETIDWDKYDDGFAFRRGEPGNFTSYILPFADVRDGRLEAKWGGVRSGMAAVLGARGGVNLPEADRRRCYDFFAGYYERFDREPPEYKEYSEEELEKVVDGNKIKMEDIVISCLNSLRLISEKLDDILIYLKSKDKPDEEKIEPTGNNILEMEIDDLDVTQVEELLQEAAEQVTRSLSELNL